MHHGPRQLSGRRSTRSRDAGGLAVVIFGSRVWPSGELMTSIIMRQLRLSGTNPRLKATVGTFAALPAFLQGTDRVAVVHHTTALRAQETLGMRVFSPPFPSGTVVQAFWWHPIQRGRPGASMAQRNCYVRPRCTSPLRSRGSRRQRTHGQANILARFHAPHIRSPWLQPPGAERCSDPALGNQIFAPPVVTRMTRAALPLSARPPRRLRGVWQRPTLGSRQR
jgi:hypothetical protein